MKLPDTIVSTLRHWHEEVDIIGLGEAHHVPAIMDFYTQLMINEGFPECRHIVVEFGVQKHQPLLDRYLAGASVPAEELALIWRDSPLSALWTYDCYRQFFQTIRELNLTRCPQQHIHVWLAEPSLPSTVPSDTDVDAVGQQAATLQAQQAPAIQQEKRREAFIALIERLRTQQQGKIVLIFGMRHLAKLPMNGRTTLAHELTRRGVSLRVLWPEMPPRFYVKPPPIQHLEWIAMEKDTDCSQVAPWGGPACNVGQLCDAVVRIPGSYRTTTCGHSSPLPAG